MEEEAQRQLGAAERKYTPRNWAICAGVGVAGKKR
jgi:hypothetical protein